MPCRKRMAGCPLSCAHRAMVEEYRLAREAAELAEERETYGYATEQAERRAAGAGPVTFRRWLTAGGWEPFAREAAS